MDVISLLQASPSTKILSISEFIKNKVYFATLYGKVPKTNNEVHFFCTDFELVYHNYYSDFGPLNLSCIYKYCCMLHEKMSSLSDSTKIVHYTSPDAHKRANAALLITCFGVLYAAMSPQEAFNLVKIQKQPFKPFQDASQRDSIYQITISDCLQAIHRAVTLTFFDFTDFDCNEFDRLSKLSGGDISWLVPGKFLAFPGPVDPPSSEHPPEIYLNYFLRNNVSTVIRLNKPQYNAKKFTNVGIAHYDMFFPDGTTPPRPILLNFLRISENVQGAIAVHCKAGLGRTGSLIGAYLIKHYDMGAKEAIAWMRLCRPGSVIGPQQTWLEQAEGWLWKEGSNYRTINLGEGDKLPCHRYGVYSTAKMAKDALRTEEKLLNAALKERKISPERIKTPIINALNKTEMFDNPTMSERSRSGTVRKGSARNYQYHNLPFVGTAEEAVLMKYAQRDDGKLVPISETKHKLNMHKEIAKNRLSDSKANKPSYAIVAKQNLDNGQIDPQGHRLLELKKQRESNNMHGLNSLNSKMKDLNIRPQQNREDLKQFSR